MMKQIQFFLLMFIFIFLTNDCSKNESPIFYNQYIDCSISTNSSKIVDSEDMTLLVDIKNHSDIDFALKYLYIQVNIDDSARKKFYGSKVFEFRSNNGNSFALPNNHTLTVQKNTSELLWNSSLRTSELPTGKYILGIGVSFGDLDRAGNQIFSNPIRIEKQ